MRNRIVKGGIWILASITVIFEGYFGILSGVGFLLQVILIALVYLSIKRIFSKESVPLSKQVIQVSIVICALFGFFIGLFLSFITIHTIFPGYTSDILITNGEKKVYFLSMSHVATESFYNEKISYIREISDSGSLFLVEGVGTGSVQNEEILNQALGFQFDKNLYATFADIAHLQVQDNQRILKEIPPQQIENRDMNLDEIASHLAPHITLNTGGVLPDSTILENIIEEMNMQERNFIKYVFRSFLNWSLKNSDKMMATVKNDKKSLFHVLLDKRNQRIVERIEGANEDTIIVLYGALHFEGVLEHLKKVDPKWKIESFIPRAPYRD